MADSETILRSLPPRATRSAAPPDIAVIAETMATAHGLLVFVSSPSIDAPKPKRKRKWRTKRWMRTRDKEQLVLYKLQLDVNDLKQQTASLHTLQSLLYTRVLNGQHSYVRTVSQYYDMMHGGFHEVLRPRSGGGLVNGHQYLYSIMDQDMRMGRLPGLDQFITMWRRYTVAFEDLEFSMASARILPADPHCVHADDRDEVVVVAESRFQARMGLEVIPYVFPSLALKPWLLDRVLGQTLQGEGQLRITFDVQSRLVVKLDMTLDVIGALFRVVRDPCVLNEILNGALLTPDCCIGDLSHLTLLPDPEEEEIKTEPSTEPALKREPDEETEPVVEAKPHPRAWQMSMEALLSSEDAASKFTC